MDLIFTLSFWTGDITTVTYRDDLAIDLMMPSVILNELMVKHVKRKICVFVLGCTANAHHTQCGSANINNRGGSILYFIIINRLNICNVGNMSTFWERC